MTHPILRRAGCSVFCANAIDDWHQIRACFALTSATFSSQAVVLQTDKDVLFDQQSACYGLTLDRIDPTDAHVLCNNDLLVFR